MGKIDIINVEKFYGSYHALREVSLSIEEGEFMVLGRTVRVRKIHAPTFDCWTRRHF